MPQPRKMPIENLTDYINNATTGNKGLLLTDRELFHDKTTKQSPMSASVTAPSSGIVRPR